MTNSIDISMMYTLSKRRIKMIDYAIWFVIGSIISVILYKAEGDRA